MDNEADEAAVVPLVPLESAPSTEAMLRMLLNREAVLIRRTPMIPTTQSSGMVAQTGGAFAKAVGNAVGQLGRSSSTKGLYQVILPTGALARDLIPAVGGGFRGMVRSAGSTAISGHVRLVPAVAGAGAAIAAGPLIATVGLAVAGEMLAQHQMNKKLNSIKSAVQGVQLHLNAQQRAVLVTAEQEARKVAGYLLDQAAMPAIAGAPHAFANLAALTNKHIQRLDDWRDIAAKHGNANRVNAGELMKSLVGSPNNPIADFEHAVAETYEAIALRARVVVLEKVAAEFSNPERNLPHVEEILRGELTELADHQRDLVSLIEDLSTLQIDGSKVPIAVAGKRTIELRSSFAKMSRALHSAPDGIPLLSGQDNTVLELEPTDKGLNVIAPASH